LDARGGGVFGVGTRGYGGVDEGYGVYGLREGSGAWVGVGEEDGVSTHGFIALDVVKRG